MKDSKCLQRHQYFYAETNREMKLYVWTEKTEHNAVDRVSIRAELSMLAY